MGRGSSGLGTTSSTQNVIYQALGLEPERTDPEFQSLVSQRAELDDSIKKLHEELESETIHSDDPEVKSLGILAAMFDEYTERGEEIKKELGEKRIKRNDIDSKIQAKRDQAQRKDNADYDKEIVVWRENKPPLVESKQSSYKGFSFDTKTSSMQTAIEKGDAIIVEMSPKEYLQRISYDVFGSSLKRGVRGVNMKNIQNYAKQMKKGVKFDMPWIDVKNKGQEGRHRAMAAILNGYPKIPVAVKVR